MTTKSAYPLVEYSDTVLCPATITRDLHSYPTAAERAADRAMTAAEAANGDKPVPDQTGRQLAPRARGEMGRIGVISRSEY